jgi:hypothetical protein
MVKSQPMNQKIPVPVSTRMTGLLAIGGSFRPEEAHDLRNVDAEERYNRIGPAARLPGHRASHYRASLRVRPQPSGPIPTALAAARGPARALNGRGRWAQVEA